MDERISMRLVSKIVLFSVSFGVFLGSLAGCGAEKRLKECASRCQAEAETCTHKHEQNCAERGRKCADACEHNGGNVSF